VLERVGVYTVEGGIGSSRVCVNLLDERESMIASPESIEVSGRAVASAQSADAPSAREIWHWLVLAGAALLVLEWAVYGLRMRV